VHWTDNKDGWMDGWMDGWKGHLLYGNLLQLCCADSLQECDLNMPAKEQKVVVPCVSVRNKNIYLLS